MVSNFYNPYMLQGNYLAELQNMKDRIDGQMQQIQQQQNQSQIPIQTPTNLTQNFQLAPNSTTSNFRLVNAEDDMKKEIVITDTYFLKNDLSIMWIKNQKGDIRSFNIEEIIPKDEKDLLIEQLQEQIKQLKGGIDNAKCGNQNDEYLYEQPGTKFGEQFGESIKTDEPTNVSIVPDGQTAKRKS